MTNIMLTIGLLMLPMVTMHAQFSNNRGNEMFHQEQVSYEFRSTSTMQGSGTHIQIAALNGVVFSDNGVGEHAASGRRRIGGSGSSTGGNGATESTDPNETPIGDGVWVLMVLAAGLLRYRMVRGKESRAAEER